MTGRPGSGDKSFEALEKRRQEMKKQRHGTALKSLSIRWILFLIFLLILSVSVAGISHVILSNWRTSAREHTAKVAGDLNEEIHENILEFMSIPEHMSLLNQKIIANGILDLEDTVSREKFFLGVLASYSEDIYSFSYGTAEGEYYGARRNPQGDLEIMRNNARTGGVSWYYSVNEDLTAGERIVVAGKFDPRTRDWYKAAVSMGGFSYSPVYKHFVMDDLTVSAAVPVYDSQGEARGVLGAHMLLSGIDRFLEEIVKDRGGFAIIHERDTGYLIANSLGFENFKIEAEGSYGRITPEEIENPVMQAVAGSLEDSSPGSFEMTIGDEAYFVNSEVIAGSNIDWVLISAIPGKPLMSRVDATIDAIIVMVFFIALFALLVYYLATRIIISPVTDLLEVSEAISTGNLSRRARVTRLDEIGRISLAFNKVADSLQFLIVNLEDTVDRRTSELQHTKDDLQRSAEKLRLLLDSTAEAIFGVDLEGRCTFTNASCLKMLGYDHENDLIGQSMHELIHHSKPDGNPLPVEACLMDRAFKEGVRAHADDEVLWRADGTCFEVEYFSHPQYQGEKIVGAVINFMDITDRKRHEERIRFLSLHDELTGLKNRHFIEELIKEYNSLDEVPVTVIVGDINGLKLTNDVFGHRAGDDLIKRAAEILRQSTREEDAIARVGGDEFLILLPGIGEDEAGNVMKRIHKGFEEAVIDVVKFNISLGSDTKVVPGKSLEEIMTNAENAMYKEKTLNRNRINQNLIRSFMETLHQRSREEEAHSLAVASLCKKIASALGLEAAEIHRMEKAGYHHDIGKIVIEEEMLNKHPLGEEELEKMRIHPIVGYRILNLFDETLDIAEGVYSHHERFNGEGYPKGLKGEEIPLMARIIAVAEVYDRMVNPYGPSPVSREQAMMAIKESSGTYFDPAVVEAFSRSFSMKRSSTEGSGDI
jgi:diguanylate cyclase (GGDEF)-like protein/PAS domain S-box-containing protein/putative nucleotidyltransferase with HDIG domain